MQIERQYRQKRSIYYSAATVFGSQARVDCLIKQYTRKLDCDMDRLYIKAGLKGLLSGSMEFLLKDGRVLGITQKSLIPDIADVEIIRYYSEKVLIIEKDSVFDRSAHPSLIVVCGKGYPCANTIAFLRLFREETEMLCMTDWDPHGIHIFMDYRRRVGRPIKRVGLDSAGLFRYGLERRECISLGPSDIKMLEYIKRKLEGEGVIEEDDKVALIAEIRFMEGLGHKVEMEAVMSAETFEILEYLGKAEKSKTEKYP